MMISLHRDDEDRGKINGEDIFYLVKKRWTIENCLMPSCPSLDLILNSMCYVLVFSAISSLLYLRSFSVS